MRLDAIEVRPVPVRMKRREFQFRINDPGSAGRSTAGSMGVQTPEGAGPERADV